jgi:hypothetical protein
MGFISFVHTRRGARIFLTESTAGQRFFLAILKVLGPLLISTAFFRFLLTSRREVRRHFLSLFLLCQGLTLHAVANVKNEGAWVEMGTSLTPLAISILIPPLFWLMGKVSNVLVSGSWAFKMPEPSTLPTMEWHNT